MSKAARGLQFCIVDNAVGSARSVVEPADTTETRTKSPARIVVKFLIRSGERELTATASTLNITFSVSKQNLIEVRRKKGLRMVGNQNTFIAIRAPRNGGHSTIPNRSVGSAFNENKLEI